MDDAHAPAEAGDHYFTAEPASAAELRPLQVRLAGRDLQLHTARGIFSPDRVDQGTSVLLQHAPVPPPAGDLLDLGSGWGAVCLTLALSSPAARVWGVDVNERALDLLRRNAIAVGATNVTATVPDDVPDDVRFAAIWSNPPIRVGKAALHDMLLRWLPRLAPGASAHLVVQRHLGSDSLQTWLTEQLSPAGYAVSRLTSSKGLSRPGGAGAVSVDHSLRAQALRHDAWQQQRVATLLPSLMDETGIDCWVVCCREYAEDPVLASLIPAQWLSARRRTVLVLARTAGGVAAHALSRYPVGAFVSAWDGGTGPDGTASGGQAAALALLVDDLSPRRIGIDVSPTFAHAGGITVADHAWLLDALATRRDALVDAEPLALAWLQLRLPEEVEAAHAANALAHEVIAAAFSRNVIAPGTTTCDDVAWWVRQRFADLSVPAWFQPTVDAQRRGTGDIGQQTPILPGDLLHCDVGLTTAGLCTDTQQLAYVLDDETTAPQGFTAALAAGNLAQDLVVAQLRPGRTGNEVLADSRTAFAAAGLDALLYSHPVGRHGHGAGPSIGLWDMQDGVPGSGDAVVRTGTLWALELGVRVAIPEWDEQIVHVGVEQGVALTETGVHYLDRRQTSLHLL